MPTLMRRSLAFAGTEKTSKHALIVLDTNVLISAGISPDGPPAKIVADHVLGGTAIAVTCSSVTAEYREVFRRAKFLRYEFPPLWLEFLIDESMQLPEPAAWTHSCPDPKDAVFLALAKAARAWLVTGNRSTIRRAFGVE